MLVFRHYDDLPEEARGAVVTIGNFDGIHRGHQAVIGAAAEDARRLGVPLVVLTFEPHPRSFFAPHDPPFRLTPFRSKAFLLEALGVDALLVLTFDKAMSHLPAPDFIQQVLLDTLAPCQITVGFDFRYGHRRAGDVEMLQAAGKPLPKKKSKKKVKKKAKKKATKKNKALKRKLRRRKLRRKK